MEEKQILSSALDICFALQRGEIQRVEELRPGLKEALHTASDSQFLASMKNLMSTALRKRQQVLFRELLEEQLPRLTEIVGSGSLVEECQDFLQFLAFNVCDKRLVGQQPQVESLVKTLSRVAGTEELRLFWNEWASLLARVVQRRWLGESTWLMQVMLKCLWRRKELKLTQQLLWQLQLQMAMFCRQEGLAATMSMYGPVFEAFLVLTDFAVFRENNPLWQPWLQLVLRNTRDLVIQFARTQMQEEEEVWLSLGELWGKRLDGSHSLIDSKNYTVTQRKPFGTREIFRVRRYLQLSITYWNLTNPKTSRRQMEYLQGLMEPKHITFETRRLLNSLV